MATIIDSLLITLGLDTKGLEDGAAKAEAARAKLGKVSDTESKAEEKRQATAERKAKQRSQDEKKRFDQTISSLKSVGAYALGAVGLFESLKGAVELYAKTSGELANLGRVAPTIGASVEEVGALQAALKHVGGTAEDAVKDLSQLGQAQTSILMHAPNAFAQFAQRLGVKLFGPKGEERDKIAVLRDIGEALRRTGASQQEQANYARMMGISEAAINLFIIKQAEERERILALAEKENKATAEGAAQAQKQADAFARIKNNVQGVVTNITQALQPAVTHAMNSLADLMSRSEDDVALARIGLPSEPGKGRDYGGRDAPYRGAFAEAEKKYGLPSGMLAAIARQESNFDPNAVSAKGARGLMQIMPKNFAAAGQDTGADIDYAAKELKRLYKHYRTMYGDQTAWKLAINAYNAGQGRIDKALAGKGKPLAQETKDYGAGVMGNAARNAAAASAASAPVAGGAGAPPTSMNGGPSTNVHIDEITINTAATDANGIAGTIAPALQRKGVVAQANAGLS